jgi:hypothetical protein
MPAWRQLEGKKKQSNNALLKVNPIVQTATGQLNNMRVNEEDLQENWIICV